MDTGIVPPPVDFSSWELSQIDASEQSVDLFIGATFGTKTRCRQAVIMLDKGW